MSDLTMALLSAEIKQLVALGALGVVAVVVLIAAALFHNTKTFGRTQQQNYQFQGQLLQLYSANNTILSQQGELLARHGELLREQQAMAAQQTEVQRMLVERIDQQSAQLEEDLQATRALADVHREMLPALVSQFAEQIRLEVIPAIATQFDEQHKRGQALADLLRDRLQEIAESLDLLRRQVEAGDQQSESHHQSILDICTKLLELLKQTELTKQEDTNEQ